MKTEKTQTVNDSFIQTCEELLTDVYINIKKHTVTLSAQDLDTEERRVLTKNLNELTELRSKVLLKIENFKNGQQ
jgi:hypothetical protein